MKVRLHLHLYVGIILCLISIAGLTAANFDSDRNDGKDKYSPNLPTEGPTNPANIQSEMQRSANIAEPVTMLLVGFGLVVTGVLIKRKLIGPK